MLVPLTQVRRLLVNLSVKFTPQNSVTELERVINDLDHRIKAAYPQAKRIFVEAESLQVHIAQSSPP